MRSSRSTLFLCILLLTAVGCGGPRTEEPNDTATETAPTEVSVMELVTNVESYEGDVVSVVGQVTDWPEPSVAVIESCTVLDCENVLAVEVPEELISQAVDSNAPLRLVGTPSAFTRDADYAGIDSSDPAYSDWVGRVTLETESAEVLAVDAVVGLGGALLRSLEAEPEKYIGRTVSVRGAIQAVYEGRVFEILHADPLVADTPLRVIAPSDDLVDTTPEVGSPIHVWGEVRWYEKELVLEMLEDEGESLPPYGERIMLAAQSIWIGDEGTVPPSPITRVIPPASLQQELEFATLVNQRLPLTDRWAQLTGQVAERIGDHGFTLSGLGLDLDDTLLVLDPYRKDRLGHLEPGMLVRIGGQASTFIQSESEEVLDIELDDEAYAPFEGEPAVLAEQIRVIPHTQLQQLRGAVLDRIVRQPDDYIGNRVAVHGRADERVADGIFLFSSSVLSSSLLILEGDALDEPIEVGEWATLFGSLARVDEALGEVLPDDLAEEFEGRPILRSDRIETD